jgi:hypothetical protein
MAKSSIGIAESLAGLSPSTIFELRGVAATLEAQAQILSKVCENRRRTFDRPREPVERLFSERFWSPVAGQSFLASSSN